MVEPAAELPNAVALNSSLFSASACRRALAAGGVIVAALRAGLLVFAANCRQLPGGTILRLAAMNVRELDCRSSATARAPGDLCRDVGGHRATRAARTAGRASSLVPGRGREHVRLQLQRAGCRCWQRGDARLRARGLQGSSARASAQAGALRSSGAARRRRSRGRASGMLLAGYGGLPGSP